jgi:hypothetical protein
LISGGTVVAQTARGGQEVGGEVGGERGLHRRKKWRKRGVTVMGAMPFLWAWRRWGTGRWRTPRGGNGIEGGGSGDSGTVIVGWRAASIGQGATVWGGGFRFNFKWNFKRIQSNSNPFKL